MALALLSSRNEPYWGDQKVYTRKNPNSNPNPKLCPNPNPNLNSNGQIADHHASGLRDQFRPMDLDGPSSSAAAAAASDDSSSFNRRPADLGHRRDSGGYVTFNISSYSRKELRQLKRRLEEELDQVRSVTSRIQSRELQTRSGGREVDFACRLPASPGSDALMGRSEPKHHTEIKKRPVAMSMAASSELRKLHAATMKKCGQILTRLMKLKGAVWFNTPVDVIGMGLHDYHQIIKCPMDLGTVKSRLSEGFYPSPAEFASDMRLTFNNALFYNPKEHEVHKLADQLLRQFESSFGPACLKYEQQRLYIERRDEELKHKASSWAGDSPVPGSVMRAEAPPVISPPPIETPAQMKPLPPPVPVQPQPRPQQNPAPQHPAMRAAVKPPPKPKPNDASKRAMTLEEKERLGYAIQNLPEEKMNEVLEIVSKRNETSRNGDEVEIDFELMDNETLWELDRLVINWNKMMSKMRRRQQEAMADGHTFQDPSAAPPALPSVPSDVGGNKSPAPVSETPEAHLVAVKKSKKGDTVDEEVDIGDELPVTHYPSLEIEKESSSSSSGSDSSSSSDSDSGSSSGSDSDDDGDAAVASRRSPRS